MQIPSMMYIAITLIVLAIVAIILVYRGKIKGQKRPSGLAFIALFLIITGILFGEDRLLGYSLTGAAIILAVIDIVIRQREQGNTQ